MPPSLLSLRIVVAVVVILWFALINFCFRLVSLTFQLENISRKVLSPPSEIILAYELSKTLPQTKIQAFCFCGRVMVDMWLAHDLSVLKIIFFFFTVLFINSA